MQTDSCSLSLSLSQQQCSSTQQQHQHQHIISISKQRPSASATMSQEKEKEKEKKKEVRTRGKDMKTGEDIPLSHEYLQRAWAMNEVVMGLNGDIKEIRESSPEGLRDPRIADIAATAWGMLQRKHEDCSSAKPCVSIL
jgi:hypothetical protein